MVKKLVEVCGDGNITISLALLSLSYWKMINVVLYKLKLKDIAVQMPSQTLYKTLGLALDSERKSWFSFELM